MIPIEQQKKEKVRSGKFPALSSEVWRLKETEGGVHAVCEVMQKYIHENNVARIQKMIQKGYSKEDILELDYTEDEYAEAEAGLIQLA